MIRTHSYILIIFLLAVFCIFNACTGDSTSSNEEENAPPDNQLEARSFYVGVSGLIARNFPDQTDADWENLFSILPEFGDFLGMHVGWNEGELDEDEIPVTVNLAFDVTANQTIKPYVAIGFEPDEMTQEEADNYIAENGQDFLNVCVTIAEKHKPDLMFIGVEINRYFEKSAEGFTDFVDLYADIYQGIKNVSPPTLVGSNFQLDFMRGEALRSGVQHEPHWEILSDFEPALDVVSFTAFPFFDYNLPADIPSDYFREITNHIDQPIMITETGWPSKPVPAFADITASDDVQVQYFERLLNLTEPLPLYALIWSFQHDPEIGIAGGLFDFIGLKNNDGSPKQLFSEWTELVERPVE